MTARTISREAYADHIASGKCLRQWMQVYDAIKTHPRVTRAELERVLHMRTGSVCGRVKEILEAGLIAEVPNVRCSVTGRLVHGLVERQAAPVQPGLFEEEAA